MKILVETNGPYEYMVMQTGDYVRADGPTVVTSCSFIDMKIAKGDIILREALLDEATDEEYISYFRESGNHELAMSSFLSKYGVNSSVVEDKPSTARTRKVK